MTASLNSQPARKQYLFEGAILKAGESLVIPLEMSVQMDKSNLDYLKVYPDEKTLPIPPGEYPDLIKTIEAEGGLKTSRLERRRGKSQPIDTTVKPNSFATILNRDKQGFPHLQEYLFGHSVRLESIEINKFGYLLRPFNPSSLYIISETDDEGNVIESEAGSCPYVYTYSRFAQSWLREGVVLYGRSSKAKESEDAIDLTRFDGRVLLKELDAEESFIDAIYVRARNGDGTQTILYPDEMKLRSVDGEYVHLQQRDQLLLHFPLPRGFAAQEYSLVATGYYIPRPRNIPVWLSRGVKRFRLQAGR